MFKYPLLLALFAFMSAIARQTTKADVVPGPGERFARNTGILVRLLLSYRMLTAPGGAHMTVGRSIAC